MKEELKAEAADLARAVYDYGQTAIFASSSDPRLHMLLYVPPTAMDGRKLDLIVAVHGTGRTSGVEFRDGFAEFCLYNDCAVLCPLFAVNLFGDGARSGYKFLEEGDIRYDLAVLDMVDEMAKKYGQDWSKFALFGFSGGGQFTNRFSLLHPERLWAASIGAPGSVTLPDLEKDWWIGVRDIGERFGKPFDAEALRRVPVHMVVGEVDLETWEITHKPGGRYYMDGINDTGRTRPERLETLARAYRDMGIEVTLDKVGGVSHSRMQVLGHVKSFFLKALKAKRA